jgi:lipocalin-like protein
MKEFQMKTSCIKKRSSKKNYATRLQNFILFALSLSFLVSGCMNETKPGRNAMLKGMYKLYNIQVQDSSGKWQDEWASKGTGYIIYDGVGHMAVHITPKGYEEFKTLSENESIDHGKLKARIDSMPADELKASLEEFVSNYVYAGNYSISDSADIVTHYRLTHTIPSAWNTTVQRRFIFKDDTLELYNDVDRRRLKWIKQN